MAEGAGELPGVVDLQHFIGRVCIRERTADSEGDDLGVWIHAFELVEEGNRTALAIRRSWLIEELLAGRCYSLSKPWMWLLLAPSVTTLCVLNGDFGVVGNISRQLFNHFGKCFLVVLER